MGANVAFWPGAASIMREGGIETLTIPTAFDLAFPVDGQVLALHFSGTIVASVPEPACLALFAHSALFLCRRRLIRKGSR